MKNRPVQLNCKSMTGAVVVEFALLLIPLIVLAFGVAEFGRATYEYNTVAKVARDSVRHLSRHDHTNTITYQAAIDEAKCLTLYGNITCTPPLVLAGLDKVDVIVTSPERIVSGDTEISLVTVTIEGYEFIFIFNPLTFFGDTAATITFDPIHATMRQEL